jgi:ApeA N-terminal domain 1
MTQDEVDSWQGYWTMPDGREIPGQLTFSEAEGATLRAFGPTSAEPEEPTLWAPALHGRTISGQDMTLIDAALYDHPRYHGALELQTSEEWKSHTLIIGTHIQSEEELKFAVGTFRLEGLEQWLREPWGGAPFYAAPVPPLPPRPRRARRRRRSLARLRDKRDYRARRSIRTRHTRAEQALRRFQPEGKINCLVDGARVQAFLQERGKVEGGGLRTVSEYVANFQVTLSTPLGLRRWERDWIEPLQDMLILCMGRRIQVESLTAHFRIDPLSEPEGMPFTVAVRRRGMADRAPSHRYHRILLPRNALGMEAGLFLRRWLRLRARIAPAAPFFFATIHENTQWLENRLLNVTSFAEAYHERLHDGQRFDPDLNKALAENLLPQIGDPEARAAWTEKTYYAAKMTQRKRLRALAERASATVPTLGQFPNLVSQLIDTRNRLTHFGPKTKWVVDDLELIRAVQRLIVVMQTNMLLDVGGSRDGVALAVARGYWRSPVLDPSEEVQVPPTSN